MKRDLGAKSHRRMGLLDERVADRKLRDGMPVVKVFAISL